jgi:hypothetical protein
MNIPNLSSSLLARILSRKSHNTSIVYQTIGTPSKGFKGHSLLKRTTAVVRIGAAFRNMSSVSEAIDAGERGEPEKPFGKHWISYPYILASDKDPSVYYVRTYSNTGGVIQRSTSEYFVDGIPTSKETYESMLPESKRSDYAKRKPYNPDEPRDITTSNLLAIKIDEEWVKNV